MEFSFSVNDAAVNQYWDGLILNAQDPEDLVITNNTPYALAIERGTYRIYSRKRARSRFKVGTVRLPKGGLSVRERFRTRVSQPAYYMARGAKPLIAIVGRRAFTVLKPLNTGRMKLAQGHTGLKAMPLLRARTPVKTRNLYNRWRF